MATRAPITFPTAEDIAALLTLVVAGVAGGTQADWRKRVGAVERLPTWRHVTHNWTVAPTGKAEQRDVINRAVELVRNEQPYVQ